MVEYCQPDHIRLSVAGDPTSLKANGTSQLIHRASLEHEEGCSSEHYGKPIAILRVLCLLAMPIAEVRSRRVSGNFPQRSRGLWL